MIVKTQLFNNKVEASRALLTRKKGVNIKFWIMS